MNIYTNVLIQTKGSTLSTFDGFPNKRHEEAPFLFETLWVFFLKSCFKCSRHTENCWDKSCLQITITKQYNVLSYDWYTAKDVPQF